MNKIIIILIIVYILLVLFRNWYVKNIIIPRFKPIQNKLIKMLPIVINVLNNNRIRYALYCGNLLGIYRNNNSFIPWDDDIDLIILDEDDSFQYRIKKVNNDLYKYNMYLKDKPFGYAVNIKTNYKKDKSDIGYIDLFIYKKNNDIWSGTEWTQKSFPNEYFKDDMLLPFKNGIFEGVNVNIPNKSSEWLKQNYGEDYLTNKKITYIHHTSLIEKILIFITKPIPIF